MQIKMTFWYKAISFLVILSLLITNPSHASLADALKPAKSSTQDITLIETAFATSSPFPVTDPEKIIIPSNIGTIKEVFKGGNDKLIINIQDAHCNFEAQTNISHILDILAKESGLKFVALEGSTGEIDPSLFTTFPDEEIKKEVAAYFLKKGEICGAEYLAITSKTPPRLYGVETKEHYLANLAAFSNTLKDRDKIKVATVSVKNLLNKLKEHIYSKELKELDTKSVAYRNNRIDLIEYCTYLKQVAKSKRVPIERFPNLGLLYETIEIEKTLDFAKVEGERSAVISALEKTLSDKELDDFLSKSVSFKNSEITAVTYYVYLRQICRTKAVDFGKYPNLSRYTDYLIIYEKIDNANLLREIAALENVIKERLLVNQNQRILDKLSMNIHLIEKMFDISLSREDVERYKRNKNDFRAVAFIDFIKQNAKKYGISSEYNPNFVLLDKYLPDLENFYRIADTRDDAIVENTLKKMEEENLAVVAIITGGYHTEGIAERLRNRGISYVVIAPRITKPDPNNPYLTILSSEKIANTGTTSGSLEQLAINSALERNGIGARDRVAFARQVRVKFEEALSRTRRRRPVAGSSRNIRHELGIEGRETGTSNAPCMTTIEQLASKGGVTVREGAQLTVQAPNSGVTAIGGNVTFENGANLVIKSGTLQIGNNVTVRGTVTFDGDFIVKDDIVLDGTLFPEGDVVYFSPESATFKERLQALETEYKKFIDESPDAPVSDRLAILNLLIMTHFWGLRGSPANLILPLLELVIRDINPSLSKETLRSNLERSLVQARGHCPACGSVVSQLLLAERFDIQPDIASEAFALLMVVLDAARNNGEILRDTTTGELQNSAWAVSRALGYTGFKIEPSAMISQLRTSGVLIQGQSPVVVHVEKLGADGNYYKHWAFLTAIGDRIFVIDNGVPTSLEEARKTIKLTGNFLVASEMAERLPENLLLTAVDIINVRGGCALAAVSAPTAMAENWLPFTQQAVTSLSRACLMDLLVKRAESIVNLDFFSSRVIARLEPRGYDNYGDARKYLIPIPEGFELPKSIKDEVESFKSGKNKDRDDITILQDEATGRPIAIRFFAIARGVGSAFANRDNIERDIREKVTRVAKLVYGEGIEVNYDQNTGYWWIVDSQSKLSINRIFLEANPTHTRFKTKGGDRAENAHFWSWKGFTLGHNGDFETYNIFRPVLEARFNETFEGTTDSEVLLHLIGDMAEVKENGKVIGRRDSTTATKRAFRLIENVEALVRASEILMSNEYSDDVKAELKTKLAAAGILADEIALLASIENIGGKNIPRAVSNIIKRAIQQPESYDEPRSSQNPHGYIVCQVGGKTVGLGEYLKQSMKAMPGKKGEAAGELFAKGLNISICVMSLYDDDNIVVGRTHEASTSLYLGLDRKSIFLFGCNIL
ncbi:MAG: hypothetical protein NC828_01445, partial [Candidatus Omnitrophica bacterium]|nr:hypothetical protein [Candidatus Omnitrophota bacterium]